MSGKGMPCYLLVPHHLKQKQKLLVTGLGLETKLSLE